MTDSNDKSAKMSTIEKAMQRLKLKTAETVKTGSNKELGLDSASDASEQSLSSNVISNNEQKSSTNTPSTKYCQLDLDELNRRGFLIPGRPDMTLMEEYRVIKRPLLNNAQGKSANPIENANLIVITSAMPGEGKTYNSLNLAISFAQERDVHVLLIDSDVIKPALTQLVGLDNVPGLTDILAGDIKDLSEVFYKTNIDKLSIVPAGRPHENDTELLSSSRMKKLTAELATRYPDRIVLFDAPPVLATSHARVMAQHAGQIILIVEAGKTLEHSVKDAVHQFDEEKMVGVVLNKGRGSMGAGYFGSYGSYGVQDYKKIQDS